MTNINRRKFLQVAAAGAAVVTVGSQIPSVSAEGMLRTSTASEQSNTDQLTDNPISITLFQPFTDPKSWVKYLPPSNSYAIGINGVYIDSWAGQNNKNSHTVWNYGDGATQQTGNGPFAGLYTWQGFDINNPPPGVHLYRYAGIFTPTLVVVDDSTDYALMQSLPPQNIGGISIKGMPAYTQGQMVGASGTTWIILSPPGTDPQSLKRGRNIKINGVFGDSQTPNNYGRTLQVHFGDESDPNIFTPCNFPVEHTYSQYGVKQQTYRVLDLNGNVICVASMPVIV